MRMNIVGWEKKDGLGLCVDVCFYLPLGKLHKCTFCEYLKNDVR